MNFNELEELMKSRGIHSLAEIARNLDTTPQAVSNWKARNQVPYHIVSKILDDKNNTKKITTEKSEVFLKEDIISVSDIFISLAEQLKIIIFVPLVTVFLLLTYNNYIKLPEYQSEAKLLLPNSANTQGGALGGIASQFGINVQNAPQADLSSPTLIPEILKSRKFAEIILSKNFYTEKHSKELTLLQIIHDKNKIEEKNREAMVTSAMGSLEDMIEFKSTSGPFKRIRITTNEPKFSQDLGFIVLDEIEKLNKLFRSQNIREKLMFIEERISSVERDLKSSEIILKKFNEKNQQISSPALQLQSERLSRNVEVQKGIYLTLKQQLELAKIDAIQQNSILQILDYPHFPIAPSNKNFVRAIIQGLFSGFFLGLMIALLRSQIKNSNRDGRKKFKKFKNYTLKKGKEFVIDTRITGILILLFVFFSPFHLGFTSQPNITFSLEFILNNVVYIVLTLSLIIYHIYLKRNPLN